MMSASDLVIASFPVKCLVAIIILTKLIGRLKSSLLRHRSTAGLRLGPLRAVRLLLKERPGI